MKLVKGIYLPDSDTHFENVIDDKGYYQEKQFRAALKYIPEENRGLFIDIGAHVGLWSRMANLNGFKELLAFEPDFDNYECLDENLEALDGNNYLCNFALSDEEGKALLGNEKSDNSGAKSLDGEWNNDDLVMVHCFDTGFSSISHYFDLTKQILIKIDVQGYEAKVVRGMTNFIKEYKPIIIVEQWLNGKEDLEATRYCESLGMKVLEKVEKEVILGW